jgi:hypothetical protein
MFGAIREYRLQPGTAEETICKIRDQFAPMVTNVPGLVGVYGRCCRRRSASALTGRSKRVPRVDRERA